MTISFLSELVTGTDDFTIRVRICRMWNAINLKKNGELISMDMIFIHEKVHFSLIHLPNIIFFGIFNYQITY